jgi:hypothetical protein
MMDGARPGHRYQMVNIRSGYVIVEHEVHSRAMRSYFSPEPVPPIEEYREGPQIWKFTGMAQTVHFDLLDSETGVVTGFDDLMGLVSYTACRHDGDLYRLGELAQEQRIWLYVAVSHRPSAGAPRAEWLEKIRVLNRYFNERLRTPNKKILILPDYFGLHGEFNHGQIMADFELTAMEVEA